MTFYIIGTGNTAWFMATRLTDAGFTCKGVWGRDKVKAEKLAGHINSNILKELQEITDDADACIIAVSDTAIADVASRLKITNTVLIHTAGSVQIDVLGHASHKGVIWPIYSIVKDNLPEHRAIPLVVETSDNHASEIANKLASAISDSVFPATWQQRQWLHLTAVLSNNFTNHLMAISEQICQQEQIPFDLLRPIIRQTAERISTASPYNLQTGPARRGDTKTIEQHSDMLRSNPEWQRLYEAITTSIDKMYNTNAEEKDMKP